MKIIFQGYNTCCQNTSGGIQNRMRMFKMHLEKAGLEIEFFNPFSTKIDNAQVIHFFMPGYENYELIKLAKEKKIKIVISTVVPITMSLKKRFYKTLFPLNIPTTQRILKDSLNLADVLIAESYAEKQFIVDYYDVNEGNIAVIPNGCSQITDVNSSIYEKIGVKPKYILQIGRFDRNKNQLGVIKAMKGSKIPVVFVGGADSTQPEYYNECIKNAEGEEFYFLDWLPNGDPLFKSALGNADTLVLPSYRETFGIVALEAAMAGAKLCISEKLPILEYPVFKECETFNPSNIKSIKEALLKTYSKDKDPQFSKDVEEYFNWDSIIGQTIEIYHKLIYRK